jgi:hypothetical protein
MSLGVIFIAVTVVSATLTFFGTVHTTMNIQQTIVIGDQNGNWYPGNNNPVARDLGNVSHCTDYLYKLLIKNQGCENADVWFTEDPIPPEGMNISHYVFGGEQTVHLAQKIVIFGQSPWTLLPGGATADVTFNTCGKFFNYTITYSGLTTDTEYALVYYANMPDYWTGNRVVVLGTFTANGGTTSGSTFGVPTMPYQNDSNALRSINDPPISENYVHPYGAKIWIIPTAYIQETDVDWSQEAANTYLFETDLAFHLNCNAWSSIAEPQNPDAPLIYSLPNVFPIFDQGIDDGHFLLEAQSLYCWITCYHLDFNIDYEGPVAFDTHVNAQPYIEPQE